jgi:hypothetical protein
VLIQALVGAPGGPLVDASPIGFAPNGVPISNYQGSHDRSTVRFSANDGQDAAPDLVVEW